MKTTLHQSGRNLHGVVGHARNTKHWKIHLTDPVRSKKQDLFLTHWANLAVFDRGLTITLFQIPAGLHDNEDSLGTSGQLTEFVRGPSFHLSFRRLDCKTNIKVHKWLHGEMCVCDLLYQINCIDDDNYSRALKYDLNQYYIWLFIFDWLHNRNPINI